MDVDVNVDVEVEVIAVVYVCPWGVMIRDALLSVYLPSLL